MIDSIVFRIHDLKTHERLMNYLYHPHTSGQEIFNVELTREDMELLKQKELYHGRAYRDFTTGKFTRFSYRDWIKSSNYDVAYSIGHDHIEFNFSVPKYLYGTNVFQFLPHRFDKYYHDYVSLDLGVIRDVAYKRMMNFIKYFVKLHLQNHVDWRCVELVRIDMTFVKIMRTREQALYYLNELKRITKQRWKDGRNMITHYNGGIWYKTRDYLFKCYHKGSEFEVNDRKQMMQMVKKGKLTSSELERIQSMADRMVRYEIGYQPSYINKVYKKKHGVLGYDPILLKRALSLEKAGYIKIGGKKYFNGDLSYADKQMYKKILKAWNRMYAIKLDDRLEKREIFLDGSLFKSLQRLFAMMVQFHSIKWSGEFKDLVGLQRDKFMAFVLTKCRAKYGDDNGVKYLKSVSYYTLNRIMQDLQYWTLKEQYQDGRISRTVYFRYQKIFKAIGIGQALTSEPIKEPENHFQEYYALVNDYAKDIEMFRQYLPFI